MKKKKLQVEFFITIHLRMWERIMVYGIFTRVAGGGDNNTLLLYYSAIYAPSPMQKT